MREAVKILLKLTLAIGIMYWLFRSGKLDFSLITRSLSEGYHLAWGVLLLIIQDIFSGIRWKWLLEVNSDKKFSYKEMIRLTWIGLFFNSFLPGAVTGDFIKLLYARDLDPKMSKTYLITSVLMDRIFGLMGLLCILGASSLIYYYEITILSDSMKNLIHFNLLLFLGAISFIVFLFIPRLIQERFLSLILYIPVLGPKIHKTLQGVWLIGDNKSALFKCLLLSVFLQILSFLSFYLVTSPFYSEAIPFKYIVTFIPLGFMSTAIPISPAGLGVGHVIFDKLYSFVGVNGGASFFNLFFIVMVCVNSFGIIPYLLSGKRHTLDEAENFDNEPIIPNE